MSFKAELHVDDQTFAVQGCHYGFRQQVDHRGRPRSRVRYQPIVVEISVTDPHTDLLSWAMDAWKVLDGKLVFQRTDADATAWHVWFRHAYCTTYFLDFDARGISKESSLRVAVVISPAQMGREPGTGNAFVSAPARAYAAPAPGSPPAPITSVLALPAPRAPGSDEHKAARWEEYQVTNAGNPKAWGYDRWEKQYHINMANTTRGLNREREYCAVMGGVSKILKTPRTLRQIDVFVETEDYCGQIKTGKVYLTEQAKIDLEKDEFLVAQGYEVEYILEQGASQPLLDAMESIGVKVKTGPQIP